MFFSNIETYSKKKMLVLTVLCNIIYVGLLVVGPSIVVGCRYAIFVNASARYKLTGVGIILFVILGLYMYIKIKKTIRKLPEIKLSQQRVKFSLEMIFDLLPLMLIVVAAVLARDNVTKAFDTVLMCLGFFIAAILFDGLFLKYIDAENAIREKALFNKEVAKRESLV